MFYWDQREGREKPIPDCGKVGCVWDATTQRCERSMTNGMGFLFDDGGFDFSGGWDAGAGFNFANDPRLTGGGGTITDSFDDWDFWAVFDLAFNQGFDEDTALMIAGGMLGDPSQFIGPDFDPIVTNEPNALPATYPIDLVIPQPQGIPGPDPSIFAPDADDLGEVPPRPLPRLPGYCPNGTYHPTNDPYACVPYPQDAAARRTAQQAKAQQGRAQQQRARQMQQPCPTGQARYSYTGQCVPTQCPTGTTRNQATGACINTTPAQAQAARLAAAQCTGNKVYNLQTKRCEVPGSNSGSSKSWLWILLVVGGVVIVARSR